jgi:hypothetical protein
MRYGHRDRSLEERRRIPSAGGTGVCMMQEPVIEYRDDLRRRLFIEGSRERTARMSGASEAKDHSRVQKHPASL